jgi:cytochrome c-type biogenesis protein CcmH
VNKFVLVLILFWALNAFAQESVQAVKSTAQEPLTQEYAENYVFADPKQRKIFLNLTAELRCPKCQNQNIADSDAPIAHDMRRKVYQLMQEGKNKAEVIDWMKQRYGNFVYYKPPVNAVTIWLWLLPVLFAIVMLMFFLRRRKPEDDHNIDAKIAQADKMLKDD